MRTTVIAAFAAAFSFQPLNAQTKDLYVFIEPVLLRDLDNVYLTNAIKAVFSSQPFSQLAKPGNDVLTITETDKPNYHNGAVEFSVSFFRNGSHLGDSIETCQTSKVSDCADQLAADAKDAAKITD